MPIGHITPVCMVVCRGMVSESDSIRNDSIELLEIMFDGRAFHSLAVQLSVVGKKYFRMCCIFAVFDQRNNLHVFDICNYVDNADINTPFELVIG